ncbi:uncharacterized protein KY384_007582 [Bacidia gigantensis]|uniref:uncharacterized protein n=1 Tax=Bacidia gigantensis TaxID=2732470 RepID=UPI001D051F9F|nr:uncharacterized protein KY384_007582 [Bacidia gigantensis]KAG8527430.1 hypothetical protein KY384_007582 [Bacidia gigantensis]
MAPLTNGQRNALETIERVASCFSLVGTVFIFFTFIYSHDFRRPVNRLIFYASWGNTLCNIGTLISESGIKAGQDSHLCQFQAFLIQMFVPADAFWNLAMAFNVYLTLFKKYNAQQLKALEWRYHALCYGIPCICAIILLFVETHAKGKIYGPAVLWCWISAEWDYLRIALLYGPAWIAILAAFTIYVSSGAEIFRKRRELREFSINPNTTYDSWIKTTQIAVTSEVNNSLPLRGIQESFAPLPSDMEKASLKKTKGFEQYSVSVASPPHSTRPSMPASMLSAQARKNRAAMEANRAAWGYTKVAILFFVSMLVTWVPSSANRLYALANPGQTNIALAYIAGIVLSLMGFWNSIIYIVTSRVACKALIIDIFSCGGNQQRANTVQETRSSCISRRSQRDSWGDDIERLTERPKSASDSHSSTAT